MLAFVLGMSPFLTSFPFFRMMRVVWLIQHRIACNLSTLNHFLVVMPRKVGFGLCLFVSHFSGYYDLMEIFGGGHAGEDSDDDSTLFVKR